MGYSTEELKKIAVNVRRGIIEAVYNAQSGHPGGGGRPHGPRSVRKRRGHSGLFYRRLVYRRGGHHDLAPGHEGKPS